MSRTVVASIVVVTLTLLPRSPAAEEPPRGGDELPAAARECDRYAEQADGHLRELRRLLARIGEGKKVGTNRQKLLAAWGSYRTWNGKLDDCMRAHFDETPKF
jgi:hypothetical protein